MLNNLGSGGTEAFVMNVYRNIDREKIQFDFLVRSNENGKLVDEIKKMGGKVIIHPPFPRHIMANYRKLKQFLKEHHSEYVAIHLHANALIYVKPIQVAKKYGIPIRIIHSHSVTSKYKMLHEINMKRASRWYTHSFACSINAGKWMFDKKKFEVINNGVDLKRFEYNSSTRKELQKLYNIENKTVIGHVGRFESAKNHKFLIEVFRKYHLNNPNSVLLLVGAGQEKKSIEQIVEKYKLSKDVIFTGAVENVEDYFSAMDVFLFPSLWEGLGMVLIEAQANGLPCITSNVIPREACLSNYYYEVDLNESIEEWVEKVKYVSALNIQRERISSKLTEFDIKMIVKKLEDYYMDNI